MRFTCPIRSRGTSVTRNALIQVSWIEIENDRRNSTPIDHAIAAAVFFQGGTASPCNSAPRNLCRSTKPRLDDALSRCTNEEPDLQRTEPRCTGTSTFETSVEVCVSDKSNNFHSALSFYTLLLLHQWFLTFLKSGNTFDYMKNLQNTKINDRN